MLFAICYAYVKNDLFGQESERQPATETNPSFLHLAQIEKQDNRDKSPARLERLQNGMTCKKHPSVLS